MMKKKIKAETQQENSENEKEQKELSRQSDLLLHPGLYRYHLLANLQAITEQLTELVKVERERNEIARNEIAEEESESDEEETED